MSNEFGGGPHGNDPGYDPAHGATGDPAYGGQPHPYWAQQAAPTNPSGVPSPDHRSRNTAIVLGVIGVAVIAVIAVVVAVALRVFATDAPPDRSASGVSEEARPPGATGCTHSETSGEPPETGSVSAGGLSFPLGVAPDWERRAEHRVPNSIDAVSLTETVSETEDTTWIGQVTVGVTNFDESLSLAEQAELMVKCVVASELYEGASPRLGEVSPESGRLDGTPTSTIEVPVSVTFADPTVRGDDLLLVIVGTSPTTYFLGSSPIGDADRRAVVEAARDQLQLSNV